jgi:hypothetical protein
MFQCLFGMFVSALVIFFLLMSGTMCMGSEFMELRSFLMRFIWHTISDLGRLELDFRSLSPEMLGRVIREFTQDEPGFDALRSRGTSSEAIRRMRYAMESSLDLIC